MNADIFERRAAISGVGLAMAGRRADRSALDLTLDAIFEALGDAGLDVGDIDGLSSWPGVSVTPGMAPVSLRDVKEALRLELNWFAAGFSILTLIWLESLGFCAKGESGPFVQGGGRIGCDGELPLNTGGGQLSAGRLHGFGLLWETCIQLWGEGGERQVPGNPQVGVAAAGGGPLAGCVLLTRQ